MEINFESLEPLEFCLEKQYYLTGIKEITVTDSFSSLNKDIQGCQEESFDDCTTRIYRNALMKKCQCLPFQLRLSTGVSKNLTLSRKSTKHKTSDSFVLLKTSC